MVTIELPFPPSLNSIWRYRSGPQKAIGSLRKTKRRGYAYLDRKYQAWRVHADRVIMSLRPKGLKPVMGRFTVTIVLDKRRRRKNSDCDNRAKAIMDCLQRMLVFEDDSMADSVTVSWGEANGARVEIAPSEQYDARKDLAGSITDGFRTIRERVATGGPAWEPK